MTAEIPQQRADRTHLQQIIAGLNDGVIILEPDQVIAWANDTALALHGVRRTADLGGTAAGYRRHFRLSYVDGQRMPAREYPMQRVLAGEAIPELMVRVEKIGSGPGKAGHHWVHSIRTMVLRDHQGRPDCLVLVINDETERFSAEQRFERAFSANPAPAVIARLSDMRFVKVNRGFLEMTGYQSHEVIGHSLHEIDVLHRAENRDQAMRRLHAGETIPQMEACLELPAGGEKTVLLGGQPIEIGDAPCMLFTFADLHARERALRALRQSEERFAKAFRLAPGPMAILTLDGLRIIDVNTAFAAATGWRREEVVGRGHGELDLWGSPAAREALERQLRDTGHLRSVDVQLRAKSGELFEFLLSADAVEIHDEPCVLSVMLDITERKQTETALMAAIDEVMQDSSWIGQRIVEKLAAITRHGGAAAAPAETGSLPQRAREVLELVARGLSDDDIGGALGISRNTVRNHVAVIFSKLSIRKRSTLIVWARERGLGVPAKSRAKPQKSRRNKKT